MGTFRPLEDGQNLTFEPLGLSIGTNPFGFGGDHPHFISVERSAQFGSRYKYVVVLAWNLDKSIALSGHTHCSGKLLFLESGLFDLDFLIS